MMCITQIVFVRQINVWFEKLRSTYFKLCIQMLHLWLYYNPFVYFVLKNDTST